MLFLSPWFLLGLLAVGAPIVAHLRRLSVQKRVAFSAVQFLDPKPPRTARRRWEDIALMIARIAVLAFFCLAFARPYFRTGGSVLAESDLPTRITVLLDTSASMRRGELMNEARRKVAEVIGKAGTRDEVELWVFDRSARVVLSVEAWNQTPFTDRTALVRDTLHSIQPGWRTGRLDEALRAAAEQQATLSDSVRKEMWVVSDFQEGTSLTSLQGIQWAKGSLVHPLFLDTPSVDPVHRASLHWMPPDPHTVSSDAPWKFQIQAAPEFPAEKAVVLLQTQPPVEWTAPVTPGKVRTTAAPVSAGSSAFLRLGGGEEFARSVWVARPPERRAVIAVQGGGDPKDRAGARYFMERGLAALGASRVELVSGESLPVERDAEVAMWVSLGGADVTWNTRMRAGVERGALAFVALSERGDLASVHALTGEEWIGSEASGEGFVTLGQFDRDHPALAAFRSPAFSDFTAIRFWRHRRLELPAASKAKVVARFEGGPPAAVEYGVGKGRVLVWASGWRPADSQWVLSSRAVPFLSSCVDWALGGRQPFLVTTPGETVPVPEGTQNVRSSAGEMYAVRDERVALETPGVFTLEPGGGVIVVNMAREECGLAPLAIDKLAALGVPVAGTKGDPVGGPDGAAAGAEAQEQLLAQELEARQSVWRWVLIAVIVLLGIETVWAGRLSKKRTALV